MLLMKVGKLFNTSWQTRSSFDYVENTWLFNSRALFSREICSQHGVFSGRPNNYAEGVHSKINSSITRADINFYELVDKLSNLHLSKLELQRLINGGPPKERKKLCRTRYKDRNLLYLYENSLINLKQVFLVPFKHLITIFILFLKNRGEFFPKCTIDP
ncbi:hypothetical protein NGRA_3211 [Nosema granulosis]|uniref:Uncharacterized protein n=1 Tax=Nosema granulosis TaxID=83296 RepID=A0A9P6GYE6_9MICR|nr:hypothetical protein NGRA_3211 [Nosema granulosis]